MRPAPHRAACHEPSIRTDAPPRLTDGVAHSHVRGVQGRVQEGPDHRPGASRRARENTRAPPPLTASRALSSDARGTDRNTLTPAHRPSRCTTDSSRPDWGRSLPSCPRRRRPPLSVMPPNVRTSSPACCIPSSPPSLHPARPPSSTRACTCFSETRSSCPRSQCLSFLPILALPSPSALARSLAATAPRPRPSSQTLRR